MQVKLVGSVEDVFAPPPTDKYPEERIYVTFRTPYNGDFRVTFTPQQMLAATARQYRQAGAQLEFSGVVRGRVFQGKQVLEAQTFDIKQVQVK